MTNWFLLVGVGCAAGALAPAIARAASTYLDGRHGSHRHMHKWTGAVPVDTGELTAVADEVVVFVASAHRWVTVCRLLEAHEDHALIARICDAVAKRTVPGLSIDATMVALTLRGRDARAVEALLHGTLPSGLGPPVKVPVRRAPVQPPDLSAWTPADVIAAAERIINERDDS